MRPDHNHWLQIAHRTANLSADPSTKVGAVIVGERNGFVSSGCNSFPDEIRHTPERWNDRDLKLSLVVHAEMKCLTTAARFGVPTKGATLYLMATDAKTGAVWGGAPCTRCAVHLISAGIKHIVTRPFKGAFSKWKDDIEAARALLEEAGVSYREIE